MSCRVLHQTDGTITPAVVQASQIRAVKLYNCAYERTPLFAETLPLQKEYIYILFTAYTFKI